MTNYNDLIIGMGEVGTTLYTLLKSRGIDVAGIDLDATRNRGKLDTNPKVLHICIPFSREFTFQVLQQIMKNNPGYVIIHSSVEPTTTKSIQNFSKTAIIVYSPVRGVHKRFLNDMFRYTKFYSNESEDGHIDEIFKARFEKTKKVSNSTALEVAKLCVDTTYYGLLIAYRKYVDKYCRQLNINPEEVWEFATEIHKFLGNRPIMYNDNLPIGGHCVLQNLELLTNEMDDVKRVITEWSKS